MMTLAGILAATDMVAGNAAVTANGIANLTCAVTLWGTGFVTWHRARKAATGNAFAATTSLVD